MGGKGGVEGNINDGIEVDNTLDLTISVPDPIVTQSTNSFIVPQPIEMANTLEVRPVNLTTESRFAVTEPIVSQNTSNIGLDVRPMVMDLCFRLEFGDFPPTCIRQPYRHHFGITFFGMEILGFNFAGESQTIIENIARKPHVVPGQHRLAEKRGKKSQRVQKDARSGLRIRLDS